MDTHHVTGGKLYNEGAYGCVFIPPLKCKGDQKQIAKVKGTTYIDKLIGKQDAAFEFAIAQRIQRIPLWRNYFVVALSICDPAPLEEQTNIQIAQCDPLKSKRLDNFTLLRMEFGGKPLKQITFNTKLNSLYAFIKHFIEAGALLNLFGIVHSDIHQGNILVDADSVPRIIDFNLSIDIRNPDFFINLQHPIEFKLFQESPDSVLVNAIHKGKDPTQIIDTLLRERKTFRKISALLGVTETTMRDQLVNAYNRSRVIQDGNIEGWFKLYWTKIDTWAVAMNIILVLSDNMLWASFPSGEYAQYKNTLLPILRDMVNFNPIERIDCIQALARLDKGNYIIRKYGKDWLNKVS